MAKPKKTKRRPRRVDPLRAWSDAELRAEANRLLNAGLVQPKQQIARERAEARRQAEADQRAIQGFTSALAGIVGEAGGRVDRVYADATRRQTDIARGIGGQQQGMDQGAADQANALLAAQGQTRRIDPGTGGQVTYALGGMVPSTLLNETGAAMSSIAHGYGAGVAGRGQQALQLRQAQARKDQAKISEMMDELMAKVPGLRSEILDKLQQREISKAATRIQGGYLLNAQNKQEFDEWATTQDLINDAADDAADATNDRNKNIAAARLARVEGLEDAKTKAWDTAAAMFKGEKVKNPKYGFTKGKDPEAPEFIVNRPKWDQAYNKLWAQYGQGLMRLAPRGWNVQQRAWWKRQINVMIVNALKNNGFKKPPVNRNPPSGETQMGRGPGGAGPR